MYSDVFLDSGVPECLIIDPGERLGILLCLVRGRYEERTGIVWAVFNW